MMYEPPMGLVAWIGEEFVVAGGTGVRYTLASIDPDGKHVILSRGEGEAKIRKQTFLQVFTPAIAIVRRMQVV